MSDSRSVRIGGRDYTIGTLNLAQTRAVAKLYPRLQSMQTQNLDAAAIDDMVDALRAFTGIDDAQLWVLPLHEVIAGATDALVAVMSVNTSYLSEQVAPALIRFGAAIQAALPQPTPQ